MRRTPLEFNRAFEEKPQKSSKGAREGGGSWFGIRGGVQHKRDGRAWKRRRSLSSAGRKTDLLGELSCCQQSVTSLGRIEPPCESVGGGRKGLPAR